MQALIEYMAKEGRAIFQAPTIFALALALCVGVVWAVLNWAYSSKFDSQVATLSSLEGRLKLKDDQIADYKDKLSGASPAEAKARMDALELQIKALTPRRLTESDKRIIVKTLNGIKGNIQITQDMAAADSKPLAADLAAAFQAADWRVTLPMMMGLTNPPPTGLSLLVIDPANLRPIEQAVRSALQAAGVDFDLRAGLQQIVELHAPPPGYPNIPQNPAPDVELILTARSK